MSKKQRGSPEGKRTTETGAWRSSLDVRLPAWWGTALGQKKQFLEWLEFPESWTWCRTARMKVAVWTPAAWSAAQGNESKRTNARCLWSDRVYRQLRREVVTLWDSGSTRDIPVNVVSHEKGGEPSEVRVCNGHSDCKRFRGIIHKSESFTSRNLASIFGSVWSTSLSQCYHWVGCVTKYRVFLLMADERHSQTH